MREIRTIIVAALFSLSLYIGGTWAYRHPSDLVGAGVAAAVVDLLRQALIYLHERAQPRQQPTLTPTPKPDPEAPDSSDT